MSSGAPIFTWRFDRLGRTAFGLAVAAVALLSILIVVAGVAGDTNGAAVRNMIVATLICAIGIGAGSMVLGAGGVVLVGLFAALTEPGVVVLALLGAGVLTAFVLVDLAITARRSPRLAGDVLPPTARATAIAAAVGVAVFAVVWFVATRTEWPKPVLPIGIITAAIGLRLLADHHARHGADQSG